jgi:hypothetical protein
MSILGSIGSIFGRLFRRTSAAPEQRPGDVVGHRGIAIGDREEPDISAENIQKWHILLGEDVAGFVYDNEPLFTHSTMIAMAQYFGEEQKIVFEWVDGGAGFFSGVDETIAIQFAQAQSKGSFCWDTFLVRGPGNKGKTRFPYTKLR